MNVVEIAQIATPIISAIFVAVIGLGYYAQVRVSRETLQEMRDERIAGSHPQVIVDADYGRLPQVVVVVRNVGEGAARDISFEFSDPVESSDGFVVSDLPYFKQGLDFLAPDGEISAYWDDLDSLVPLFREKGITGGITVTTRYKDLAGKSYETRWNLNPTIYKDHRYVQRQSIESLVQRMDRMIDNLERIATALEKTTPPRIPAGGQRHRRETPSGDNRQASAPTPGT